MKRHFLVLFVLCIGICFIFAGCSSVQSNSEPKSESISKPTPKPVTPSAPKTYQNNSFRDVTLTKTANRFDLTGKASVFEGNFQYAVVENKKVIIQNHYQTDGAPAWGGFSISFEQTEFPASGMIELFVYSAKDGSKMDVLTIPFENK